jgi:hypothetical protein
MPSSPEEYPFKVLNTSDPKMGQVKKGIFMCEMGLPVVK